MNKIFPIFLIVFSGLIFLNSCDDDDAIANELLYGGGDASSPTKYELAVSMNQVNGWYMLDGSHLYGFDLTIKNNSKEIVYDVKPVVKSISPSTDVISYDGSSEMLIGSLSPSQSLKPDYHWYVDNSGSTIYIGNFYLTLQPYVSSGKSYEVSIEVTFMGENQITYKQSFVKSFTTINIFLSLPI